MKKIIIAAAMLLTTVCAQAQEGEDYKLSGNISVAANNNNTFLNFGGPNIKFEKGAYGAALSFFPSLRSDSQTNTVSPILGAGLILSYNKFSLVAPNYYYGNNWYTAIGLGYKF